MSEYSGFALQFLPCPAFVYAPGQLTPCSTSTDSAAIAAGSAPIKAIEIEPRLKQDFIKLNTFTGLWYILVSNISIRLCSMRNQTALCLAGALLLLSPFAAKSYEVSPKFYGDIDKHELGLCGPTRTEEYIQYQTEKLPKVFPGVEVFTITEDWRSQDLESTSFPLSKPVILKNPITGTTIGVFDRNYNRSFRVASFFGRNTIRVRQETIANKSFGRRETVGSESIQSFGIKNKDGYLVVNGCDGVFRVNKAIADALLNYDLVNGKAFVLLSNDGSTGLRINEIGPETVKAWKVIYSDWDPAIDGRKKSSLN